MSYNFELTTIQNGIAVISFCHPLSKGASHMSKVTIYRAKCLECKHEWTSRAGYGTPNCCPKPQCRSPRIQISPIG